MSEHFQSKIIDWVNLDNEIREMNDKLRLLRNNRTEILNIINTHVEENKLHDTVIQINDGQLRFQTTKTPQPLSMKFIKECLTECISNEDDVNKLIDYIKQKRVYKESNDIRRTITGE